MATFKKDISGVEITFDVELDSSNVTITFTDPADIENSPGTTVALSGSSPVVSNVGDDGCMFILTPAGNKTWNDVSGPDDLQGLRVCTS